MNWKTFYTLAAMFGVIYGFLYWFEVMSADNISTAFYCWGFSMMCLGEALGKERHK